MKTNAYVNICWLMSSVISRWLNSTRSSDDLTSSAFLCSATKTTQYLQSATFYLHLVVLVNKDCVGMLVMMICWWLIFARLIAPVVHSVILNCNKVQNGDILVLANPGCPGKWSSHEQYMSIVVVTVLLVWIRRFRTSILEVFSVSGTVEVGSQCSSLRHIMSRKPIVHHWC